MASTANPLNLPLDLGGRPHQLRLTRINGQDAERRAAVCTPAINHITSTRATALFNGLDRNSQIAALLIEDEEGTHTRLDAFLHATTEFRHRALYKSDHKDGNIASMYQEDRLGFIAEFMNYRRDLGFHEVMKTAPRVGQHQRQQPRKTG